MNLVEKIKDIYKLYKDRAFLKKHGCETWKEYNRKFDPDYNFRADRIQDYYHGYPYVYCFENRENFAYTLLYDYGPGGFRYGCDDINDWCTEKLKGKFRIDVHRVHKMTPIGIDGKDGKFEFWINEIGGSDYIFAAFKNERDYVNFLLRWA